jgi:septal ring factor EnvC (AmiA/AmiB activator)
MYFNSSIRIFVAYLLLMASVVLSAQTVSELEIQRKQTLKRLETTSKMLSATKKSKSNSLINLSLINKNIKERKTLISNINGEIGVLNHEISKLDREKIALENKLKSLKADYAKLVQDASINRSVYNKFMFVLSAQSFDQSLRRFRYIQEYSDYREKQVREIENTTQQITLKNDSLVDHKTTKVEVVKIKVTETQNLSKDEQKEKSLLTDLQKEEQKLRSELREQQKRANDLNNKIEAIIAAEIRKAEAKKAAERSRLEAENNARLAARQKVETKTGVKTKQESIPSGAMKEAATHTASVSALTREETLLSGNFERNAGRLPWPVTNGFISGHFGVQPHPMLRHVTTNNKGIYIQTPANSTARAVFEGIVTQRFSIPGSNNAVIIKHGNFRTVYANLTQILVGEGDHVSAKQPIGKIYTDDEGGNKTELYFQVWKDKNLLNPETWITK